MNETLKQSRERALAELAKAPRLDWYHGGPDPAYKRDRVLRDLQVDTIRFALSQFCFHCGKRIEFDDGAIDQWLDQKSNDTR